jgi:hypothetical protein
MIRLNMKTSLCLLTIFSCGILAADTPQDAVRLLAMGPLRFEPVNDGRTAHFVARGARFRFAFSGNKADFLAGGKSVSLRFQGAAPQARLEGVAKLRSTTNAFLGNDPAQWQTKVPNYGRLQVLDLYPGIDLVYYGNAGELEYDLTVKPGVDPAQIRLRLNGGRPKVDSGGNLVAGLIQKRPVAYQLANGIRIPVESRYRKNADGSYGFALGAYDRQRELIIDPVLTLSVYLSGSRQDIATAIGHDATGFLYVAGTTESPDLPLAGNSFQATPGGTLDIFLAKIDPNAAPGTQLVYSTYLGGTSNDSLGGMAVGPNGDVYLTGNTVSHDFPMVNSAQTVLGGTSDAFVAWFDSSQNLAYSTFLGGGANDFGMAVTFDSKGKIYVTGGTISDDFPNTGGYQTIRAGSQDAFVTMIDPSLSGSATIVYSSYLGGAGWEAGRGIAVAPDGTIWVVGGTYSGDFPVIGVGYQPGYSGGGDGYAAQFNPALGANSLVYTTYLGGTDQDEARNVLVDPAGRVIVSGWTLSKDFPVTGNAMQMKYGGNTDVFVTILNPANQTSRSAQLIYSTYFGGTDADVAFDLKRDAAGNLYLSGLTLSYDLPSTPNAVQSKYDGTIDAFALKFNPAQAGPSAISYFTYLGSDGLQAAYGIDFNSQGNIFLTGFTSGPIFDALGGAPKTSNPGKTDAFIIGLSTAK